MKQIPSVESVVEVTSIQEAIDITRQAIKEALLERLEERQRRNGSVHDYSKDVAYELDDIKDIINQVIE